MKNSREVAKFMDGTKVYFADGNFDQWCLFYKEEGKRPRPLLDTDYFTTIKELGRRYGQKTVHNDFKSVYNMVDVHQPGMRFGDYRKISSLTKKYGKDWNTAKKVFIILYLTMFAEENRVYGEKKLKTKVGKQIKAVGISDVLINNMSVSEAANRTKGMSWKDIRDEAVRYGFQRAVA